VAKIVTNAGSGAYTITQLWWNPDADPAAKYDDAVTPAGVVAHAARDYLNRAGAGVGQKVPFWTQRRKGGRTEFLIDVTRDRFTARITASTKTNGTATAHATDPSTQWTYTFVEVEKTGTGYSAMTGGTPRTWTDRAGGRTGTAYNLIEDINTRITHALGKTERMGNGVVLENLDYDSDNTYEFAPRPVPDETPVEIEVVCFKVGDTEYEEYWFSYENGVDGECD